MKPANLFLCRKRSEPDTLKVLDFGLAKDVATEEPALSAADAVLGTPLYMSPETILEPDAVDARSDLYSLGAVAYLMLTGTPVFSGSSTVEVCAKHLHTEPERPSSRLGDPLPADLEASVLSCLAKAPASRPRSARALREALDGCVDAGAWSEGDAEEWWLAHVARVEARRRVAAQGGASGGRTMQVQ